MTSIALTPSQRLPSLSSLRAGSPLLWWTSLVFLALFAAGAVLAAIDPRTLNGISVWIKPAKFYLSLAVHMLTLSFGLLLLPERVRNSLSATAIATAMAAMAILEMLYITFRAARAEASHFNTSSEIAALLYNLMGMGAAVMMLVTAWLGVLVIRHGTASLVSRATGWSFILAAVLTLIVGFTLGGMGSHWIGGDRTDATGLPLIGWSTTGGDLRAAHFFGLHLMQALPLAALMGSRMLLWFSAAGGVLLTIATYFLALNGIPLIAY